MRFQETRIPGVFVIEAEPCSDERGYFARTWCAQEFAAHGLETHLEQCGTTFNHERGTLRGMHYQAAPHGEQKLVRCTQGAIFDVAVDLREDSPHWGQWFGVMLTAQNHRMLYIPVGCAHGYLTLSDQAVVSYQLSASYHADSARGARWNDPALAIAWPQIGVQVISERDRQWPLLDPKSRRQLRPLATAEAQR